MYFTIYLDNCAYLKQASTFTNSDNGFQTFKIIFKGLNFCYLILFNMFKDPTDILEKHKILTFKEQQTDFFCFENY